MGEGGALPLILILHGGILEMERDFKSTISILRNFMELMFLIVMAMEYLCLKSGLSFSRLAIYVIQSSNCDAFESKMRAINNV